MKTISIFVCVLCLGLCLSTFAQDYDCTITAPIVVASSRQSAAVLESLVRVPKNEMIRVIFDMKARGQVFLIESDTPATVLALPTTEPGWYQVKIYKPAVAHVWVYSAFLKFREEGK